MDCLFVGLREGLRRTTERAASNGRNVSRLLGRTIVDNVVYDINFVVAKEALLARPNEDEAV